jgi:hypothetical protein
MMGIAESSIGDTREWIEVALDLVDFSARRSLHEEHDIFPLLNYYGKDNSHRIARHHLMKIVAWTQVGLGQLCR